MPGVSSADSDDGDLKMQVAVVHEAITDFQSVKKQLENKTKKQFSLHFKYLKLIFLSMGLKFCNLISICPTLSGSFGISFRSA